MASKKQQQQKKKLRMLKKKKAEAKILDARNADPEKKSGERGAERPNFGPKNSTGLQGARATPPMHRPQGG